MVQGSNVKIIAKLLQGMSLLMPGMCTFCETIHLCGQSFHGVWEGGALLRNHILLKIECVVEINVGLWLQNKSSSQLLYHFNWFSSHMLFAMVTRLSLWLREAELRNKPGLEHRYWDYVHGIRIVHATHGVLGNTTRLMSVTFWKQWQVVKIH